MQEIRFKSFPPGVFKSCVKGLSWRWFAKVFPKRVKMLDKFDNVPVKRKKKVFKFAHVPCASNKQRKKSCLRNDLIWEVSLSGLPASCCRCVSTRAVPHAPPPKPGRGLACSKSLISLSLLLVSTYYFTYYFLHVSSSFFNFLHLSSLIVVSCVGYAMICQWWGLVSSSPKTWSSLNILEIVCSNDARKQETPYQNMIHSIQHVWTNLIHIPVWSSVRNHPPVLHWQPTSNIASSNSLKLPNISISPAPTDSHLIGPVKGTAGPELPRSRAKCTVMIGTWP